VAREVVVPVALAGLFTFLLSPVDKALQKRGMARGLSVGLITTVSLLLVGAIAWVVAEQVTDFAGQLPMYKGNIRKRIDDLRWDGKGTALAKASDTVKELAGEVATNSASTNAQATPAPVPVTVQRGTTQTALSVLTPVMETLFNILLIIVLVLFMLLEREELRIRLILSMGEKRRGVTTKALDDAGQLIRRYLIAQSMVNACVATVIGIALFVLGVPYALLWAFTIAMLRFIPYVGIWIAGTLPLLVSLATSTNWFQPFAVVGAFVIFEPLVGMVLEPILFGRTIGISKLAMLISITFWTWMLGPVGLLLATPLTACLLVIARLVPDLNFLAVLLSDEPVS
jgi:predicted PurR-regulated permease PerM